MRVALAGDTMLGRGVSERLRDAPPRSLVSSEVVAAFREADLVVLNLECCISERGSPWPASGKQFFFRAPPRATELLVHLGVRCVTLANNHALDFGPDALLDTFGHLEAAGLAWVGAGPDVERARAPAVLEAAGLRLAVFGATDHPSDFAAAPGGAGVALVRLERPDWLADAIAGVEADVVLVSPHWGPNMVDAPGRAVRRAAAQLVAAGATLVAGHSAHVFHGVAGRVVYDLGDFLDDYRADPRLRNDLGMLVLVDLEAGGPTRLEAVPLKLDFAYTRLAEGDDAAWVERRFRTACAQLGTTVRRDGGRLVVDLGITASCG
jgi:poly-gamma-glutamate capsule biosynthesis protein CapA/YwtB (metallophosphatase superfamily)